MKNKYSFIACLCISLILIVFRVIYTEKESLLPVKVTTWDALGYYMYLPSQFIYHDEKKLAWFPSIDSTYSLTGGELYQANKQKNGSYVFKYLKGVSMLQAPFFFIAHVIALCSCYKADGFSAPYQYAVAWGCICYVLLALFMLRKILLRYYKDAIVSITLILLFLASNLVQYVAIEGGQSHGYIFPLYVFLLYATIQWHENRKMMWSFLMSFIIGIAVICRPTELVMIVIPIFWGVVTKEDVIEKFKFILQNPVHIFLLVSGFILAILPQLLYWKRATGSFVYDVGSKWDFLNPHFRVLFGWEKGWFIYTPVALLFVVGLFFIKQPAFKRSAIVFCLLNIYIIIAWHVWRYGGSYSCRALVQSYPVFALPLAALVETILHRKWKVVFYALSFYLVLVNLFQIQQYNQGILHFNDMNASYYKAIYLNQHPTPIDMSLLDTKDVVRNESLYQQTIFYSLNQQTIFQNGELLFNNKIPVSSKNKMHERWIKVYADIKIDTGLWGTYLVATLKQGSHEKETKIRLYNALAKEGQINRYAFFIKAYNFDDTVTMRLSIEGNLACSGTIQKLILSEFDK